MFPSGALWLAACRAYARHNASCLTAGFLALVPREQPGLGTMGVTKDGRLLYDPELRHVWSVKQGGTVLFHELWHVLRRHHDRCDRVHADPKVWNCAGDAEINDDLPPGGTWELPTKGIGGGDFRPVLPERLFELVGEKGGLPNGQMAETYWEALRDKLKKKKGQKGEGKDGQGEGKPGPGWCGSAAGNPLPGEPAPDAGSRSQRELECVRKEVAAAIQAEAAKGRGSLPGGWTVWAESQLAPPKVSWQTKLSKIARSAVEWAAGAVDYRYSATSRRQGGVGYGPGRPILPALRAPKPRVLVVADTSGSMGQAELTTALSEIKGVLATTTCGVTFAAADAAVHEMREVKNWREIIPLLKGGGGTDFGPAFEAASKMRPRPSVIIFATDGDGTCPDSPPPGMRVIWLLTGKHAHEPCSWGEKIRLE
jgi:predicted metal-dependent peptidase